LSDFNEFLIFSTDFSKNNQISNFMKQCPVGAESFHEDGRPDRHVKTHSRFSKSRLRA